MRPPDLPPAERFAHGTCSRYVTGCRCRPCRDALRDAERERQRKYREARAEVTPNDLPPLYVMIPRSNRWAGVTWTKVPACGGTGGRPCVRGGSGLAAWIRGAWLKNGGRVCHDCAYRATVWNGFVSADRAREHIRMLSDQGVGAHQVSDAAKVACSTISDVARGAKRKIRARTERRILDVDAGARADGSQVPSKRSFAIIDELRTMGFTWGQLSRELGLKEFGACNLRHGRAVTGSVRAGRPYQRTSHERPEILARTALKVEKLYRRVVAGEVRPARYMVDGAETWHLVDELLKSFTLKVLAKRLGVGSGTLGAGRRKLIRPTTAAAVKRLHDELLAAHREGGPLPDGWQTSANPVTPMGAEEWVRGGWSVARRTSKVAKEREKKELLQLARGRTAA